MFISRKKLIPMILLILTLSLILSGCGKKDESLVSFEDEYGYVTEIKSKPMRIVSLAPNITEIIVSLGTKDNLVGRTEYCDYPAYITNVETVGDYITPSVEKITALNPDLVITDGAQGKDVVETLRGLGINVVVIRGNESIEGTYEIIKKVGQVMIEDSVADSVISSMRSGLENIKSNINTENEQLKVYYVVGFGEYGEFTATGDTYIGELIDNSGAINVAKDATDWVYSLEQIYADDPDIIICSKYYEMKAQLLNYEGFKNLRAIKEGNIVEIDNNLIDRQGPRMVDGYKELVNAISKF